MGQIEGYQVVTQQVVHTVGKVVQFGQCRRQAVAHCGNGEALTSIWAYPGETTDAAIPDADFKVQRKAAAQGAATLTRRRSEFLSAVYVCWTSGRVLVGTHRVFGFQIIRSLWTRSDRTILPCNL